MKWFLSRVGRLTKGIGKASAWMLRHGAILILLVVGLYFTSTMLNDLRRDTTSITNAAFAILASLAALSFSWSRAISAGDVGDCRDRACYAGERLFHAAILMLVASLLKYAVLFLATQGKAAPQTPLYLLVVETVVGVPVSGLFLCGVLDAHTGFRVLNNLLWARLKRHRDWDDFL